MLKSFKKIHHCQKHLVINGRSLKTITTRLKGIPQSPTSSTGFPQLTVAIRREDASIWERRAPLAPFHVRQLTRRGVRVLVQPSNRRAYPIQAYVNCGAIVQDDISESPVILGVKQVPIDSILPEKTYCFFSHTIKAQEDNMALLDTILKRNVRLIDYEKLVDEDGVRVVAFGHYAGVAGMINILHGLGLRLLAMGHHTPFMHIGLAHNYRNSSMARQAVRDCGYEIATNMMPRSIGPLTFVFTGSGNVSQGAQEILKELPVEYVEPKELGKVSQMGVTNKVYATVVSREDYLVRKDGSRYDREDYNLHPEDYYSTFARGIAPFASVIVNGIYYAIDSPKLLTIPDAKRLLQPLATPWLPSTPGSPALPHRLLAVCDISADPGGSIEFMTECTNIDNPFCLYDADYNNQRDSFAGPGVLVCSIDNMPTQLPLESTDAFGNLLMPYILDIVRSDAMKEFEDENFCQTVKGATIASNGKLTPNFEYIMELRKNRTLSRTKKGKQVLLLGAGYVSKPLVEYLTRDSDIQVMVGSEFQGQGELLTKISPNVSSSVLDVMGNTEQLDSFIAESDLVISLLPYVLHPMIAEKCIKEKKNLVTASYTSQAIKDLEEGAIRAGVTLVNEVGLDPGIDHLLAMECFDQVASNGGRVVSFVSYCGGLPAPEFADNPLRYKFSWNPKGVLLNSITGAKWYEDGKVVEIENGGLMDSVKSLDFLHGFNLEGYANRDSTVYKDIYGISNAETVLRGTIRYKGFCDAIKSFGMLGLIDSTPHPSLHPKGPELNWRQFLCTLLGQMDDILLPNLKKLVLERVGNSELRLRALEDLGFFSQEPVDKRNSPLDTITHYLGAKLRFLENERDVIIMRHEVGIQWPNNVSEMRSIDLVVYGEANGVTAMAKCVGYPAAIAAKMLLEGEIQKKGLVVPMKPEIYHPMLKRLAEEGIKAIEKSYIY